MGHRPLTNNLGGTWGQKLLTVFFSKTAKNQNLKKSLKISRGIAIIKQHTKSHRGATNRSSGTRGQKFLSVFFFGKTAQIKKNQNIQKSLKISRGITITKLHTKFHPNRTKNTEVRNFHF